MESIHKNPHRGNGSSNHQDETICESLRTLTTELADLETETRTHLINMRKLQTLLDPNHLIVLKESLNTLVSELDILEANICSSVFSPILQRIKEGIIDIRSAAEKRKNESSELKAYCQHQESKIQILNEKVEDRENTIQTLYKKVEVLESILNRQNLSATRLSATLSDTLWKLSRDSRNVEMLICRSTVSRLCDVVNDSMESFHATYSERAPPVENDDDKNNMISLIGLMMNIAALREGRQLIIQTSEGQKMIHCVIQYVAIFPGLWAKRLLLMLIFNVCIHKKGTKLVIDKRCLFEAIKTNVMEAGEPIPYLSFKLLQVIVCNTDKWKDLKVVLEEIPLSFMDEIEEISSDEIRDLISEIRHQYRYLEITTGRK